MKMRRFIFITLGFIFFALGTLGIFLPILPTVPLYLLTFALFANSSRRLQEWYQKTKLYKKYLLPYLKAGGLSEKAKVRLIGFVTLQIFIAIFILRNSTVGIIMCFAVYLGFILSVLFAVKTVILNNKGDNEDE